MLWFHRRISGFRNEVPENCAILGWYAYTCELRNRDIENINAIQDPIMQQHIYIVSNIRIDALIHTALTLQ